MSGLALVFPGQGSQYVGMAKDFAAGSERARRMCADADRLLGVPLSTFCFEGPEETLRRTEYTQPAIFLHSMIAAAHLPERSAAMVAGHSLGEYSALVHAGALVFEDGLRLVRLRGQLMQRAGEEYPGTMAAVIGLEPDAIRELCAEASAQGVVQPANFNSPGQVVVSGSVEGVRAAMDLARSRGARMVKELVVSGAFHSPLMESARAELRRALDAVPMRDASIPVYANVSAAPVHDAGEIRTLLDLQITSPVRWEESVRAMAAGGAVEFHEVGPGKVLQGLIKRTLPAAAVRGFDTFEDCQRTES